MSAVNNTFINERLTSLRNFLNEQLDLVQKELIDNYDTNMNEVQSALIDKSEEVTGLSNQVTELTAKNSKLNEENLNYQKVSLVKSLNNQLSEKDGEIKFLNSKIKQLNELVEKLKGECSSLQEENAQMNTTLGSEVIQLVTEKILPHLLKGTRVVVETELRELVTKYDSLLSYVTNTLVLTTLLTNLEQFGNVIYSIATSLKKVGVWFKSPVIKKIKTICGSGRDCEDKVVDILNLLSENDVISSVDIESWASQFSSSESLNKLSINEELFKLLLPDDSAVTSTAAEEDAVPSDEEEEAAASEAAPSDEEEDVEEEATEEVEEEVEEDAVASEEEVEFFEQDIYNPKKKKKITYLITDDEHRDIYEQDEDGQPTDNVGRLVGKNNKAHFF